MPPPPDHRFHEITFYVRYFETDAMRIVHHANYLAYCEEGRSAYSRAIGANYADFEKAGFFLAVSEVNLRYLSPALYGQQVTVRVWVEEIKSRRIVFAYEIYNPADGTMHVTGVTRHICITQDGKVTRIPEDWVERWSPNPNPS
ncbi:MAG: acyl-CoA thioesterase [Chloroflexota bacterium]|nr:acyl-CoA thioesterase [Chloroflexota bacterium]NOG65095.1 acyl-CoA thioesterase [Chloroflexota bacterium]GIK63752.1 MAG: acyl-CoA thioesterase [Chloroflexota bacterium]